MPSRPKKPDLYAGHHDPPLIRAPRIESAGADRRSNPATHAEHRHAAEPPIPSREASVRGRRVPLAPRRFQSSRTIFCAASAGRCRAQSASLCPPEGPHAAGNNQPKKPNEDHTDQCWVVVLRWSTGRVCPEAPRSAHAGGKAIDGDGNGHPISQRRKAIVPSCKLARLGACGLIAFI